MGRNQNRSAFGGPFPAGRLRDLCLERGWDFGELARRAAVSRTTLYQLDRRRIRRPHSGTLGRVAAALGISPAELCRAETEAASNASGVERTSPTPAASAGAAFDRATNPVVTQVSAERPDLFDGWTEDEWTELYSTFGVGGRLSSDGVVVSARNINRKRKVVQQLQVILETHLADVAVNMIAALYAMVRVGRSREESAESADQTEHCSERFSGIADDQPSPY